MQVFTYFVSLLALSDWLEKCAVHIAPAQTVPGDFEHGLGLFVRVG